MPFDNHDLRLITPATVLILRARELISHPSQWCVGRTERGRLWWKRRCVIGALERAIALFDLTGIVYAKAAMLEAARNRGFATAYAFNDHPSTTHEMVLEFMLEAAELAKRPVV